MFQNFKIKFGIQISLIIGALFLGVFIFVFFRMKDMLVPNLYAEMAQAASQPSISEKEHFIRFFEHPVYFYAKIDSDGNITESSYSPPIFEKMLTRLVDLAYNTNSSQGLLEPDSMDSYLFTKVVTNYSDITIVFTLSNAPDLLNRHLFSVALSIFLWCLSLIIIASILITNRTLKPIKKAWDRQIEFSADASHELRTPLSIIQLNLELINAQPDATIHSQKNGLMESTMKPRRCQNLLKTYFFFQERIVSNNN